MASSTFQCQNNYFYYEDLMSKKQTIPKDFLLSLPTFYSLKFIFFENFIISDNNITSVKVGKVPH
jgi:hypothetical protein